MIPGWSGFTAEGAEDADPWARSILGGDPEEDPSILGFTSAMDKLPGVPDTTPEPEFEIIYPGGYVPEPWEFDPDLLEPELEPEPEPEPKSGLLTLLLVGGVILAAREGMI